MHAGAVAGARAVEVLLAVTVTLALMMTAVHQVAACAGCPYCSRGFNTSSPVSSGPFSCNRWPAPGAAVVCDAVSTGAEGKCEACASGIEFSMCQARTWSASSPPLGTCVSGSCVPCSAFDDDAGKCTRTNHTRTDDDYTMRQEPACSYHTNSSGAGVCDVTTPPCQCQDSTTYGTSVPCVDKGFAPADSFCPNEWNFNTAAQCDGVGDSVACQTVPCTWYDADPATVPDAFGAGGHCGGCACECNGCTSSEGHCIGANTISAKTCATIGGAWCGCQDVKGAGARVCGSVFTGWAFGSGGGESPQEQEWAAAACAEMPGCMWSATTVNALLGTHGQCGECFTDGHCASGACDPGTHECVTCAGTDYCNGHGTATHEGAGVCECTCDTGYTGVQCEYLDCTSTAAGETCTACVMGQPCLAQDGARTCGRTTAATSAAASNGGAPAMPMQCGAYSTQCSAGPKYANCSNGGKGVGNSTDMCYCDCTGTGFTGPHCEDKVAPAVHCTAPTAPGADTFTVTSGSDRYLKMRRCESPDHKCSGSAPAGSPKAYIDCGDWLPPHTVSSIVLPNATTVIVFVDPECPNNDTEIWRPTRGWGGSSAATVKTPCVAHVHPLTCAHMPATTCKTMPYRNRLSPGAVCAYLPADVYSGFELEHRPVRACDVSACCSW